ncbi:PucR-like helix-turn-helix protein [Naumannella halotolerans]|uniref:PucR-like helix-turn-helix protein n=1 Tax=Naumannella halotolerans TaxID=993414 RepID=A0A4R7JBI6_9ACTN|nr:PucR-like helix-turn-helix protein [Naumannella halotolerans]
MASAKLAVMPTDPASWPWWPSTRTRNGIVKRLRGLRGQLGTAAAAEMEHRHDWFGDLDAEHRSWIAVVAQTGIDGFITWFADPSSGPVGAEIFRAAPQSLTRQVSLHQTVELVRTTIEVVETKTQELMPRGDRPVLGQAIMAFSREVAFGAAELYARAAETRGAWDARLEALVVDAVVRGEADDTVLSRASTLGWQWPDAVMVVVGGVGESDPDGAIEDIRRRSGRLGLDLLASTQGDRLVVVLGGEAIADNESRPRALNSVLPAFADGPVVVGPVVDHLVEASASARAAFSGLRAVPGWPGAPRPVESRELLPERALSGDGHARRALNHEVYRPLRDAGGGLLETLEAFLNHSSSVEGAARDLFVHPNTVRYRLKRIAEICDYSPTDPREAYFLRLALTLGRLMDHA